MWQIENDSVLKFDRLRSVSTELSRKAGKIETHESTTITGYEISYRDRSYRLSVWITGFYEVLRYSEVSCPAEKRAYDRDNNIIQNWCEVSQ